jgi:hypothetical protein
VDKVLIYRYFGGMPELLTAFAEETGFWPDLKELLSETDSDPARMSQAERATVMLLGFGRALRRRPGTQEILRWELLESNELTEALARHREEQSAGFFRGFDASGGIDVQAVGSLLAAGQTYLALRFKNCEVYNGIDLGSEEGWSRIDRAVRSVVDAVFAKSATVKLTPAPQAARKRTSKARNPARAARKS